MTTIEKFLDLMQDSIARVAAENPDKVRVVTLEMIRERIDHYAKVAIEEVRRIGPESDSDNTDFCPTAVIIDGLGIETDNLRCGFNQHNKYDIMAGVSAACKTLMAQALILRHLVTFADVIGLSKAMGINPPDPYDKQKIDYFHERLKRWSKAHYGVERFAHLPAEFRRDCIMVNALGPKLPQIGAAWEYRWKNGKLEVEVNMPNSEMVETRNYLIPRWWE